jgi:8-hydroxy-5-deazaflavin:NADPH oxidoreductase
MRIAVIGAGSVGGTLGRRWASLGHEVVFGVRRPEEGAAAVKGGSDEDGGALPPNASVAALRGVPLLDATNPLAPGLRLDVGPDGASGAERVQAMAPEARVVKVFNTTGYNNMRDPVYGGAPTVMFHAGDDAGAKAVARELSTALGFDAVDAGPLTRARELEHLALLWISLAAGGMGRDIAFRLVRR